MHFSEWEPVYIEILKDLGLDRSSDEASARSLKAVTLNSDLISEEFLASLITTDVIIIGGNVSDKDTELLKMISKERTDAKGRADEKGRAIISAGSATDVLVMNGIIPDIVVTDLDGDVELQKKASLCGAVTLIHAHGDNSDLITKHSTCFKGPIMITTQSRPDLTICNFGGFTDGDRAVCTARHFGAKRITLIGFDLDVPAHKPGTDMQMKKRKLQWAKKVIFDMDPDDIVITSL